jgi:hypothetical protein
VYFHKIQRLKIFDIMLQLSTERQKEHGPDSRAFGNIRAEKDGSHL